MQMCQPNIYSILASEQKLTGSGVSGLNKHRLLLKPWGTPSQPLSGLLLPILWEQSSVKSNVWIQEPLFRILTKNTDLPHRGITIWIWLFCHIGHFVTFCQPPPLPPRHEMLRGCCVPWLERQEREVQESEPVRQEKNQWWFSARFL